MRTGRNLYGGGIVVTVGYSEADYIVDGAADNIQIQEAINAVYTAGGGTVYLKKGLYTLATSLKLRSNVKLIGSGANLTFIYDNDCSCTEASIEMANPSNINIGYIASTDKDIFENVELSDMTIYGNSKNHLIRLSNITNLTVKNLEIYFTEVYKVTKSCTFTSGSRVVTMASTAGLITGQPCEAITKVMTNAYIHSIDSATQVTLKPESTVADSGYYNGEAFASGTVSTVFAPRIRESLWIDYCDGVWAENIYLHDLTGNGFQVNGCDNVIGNNIRVDGGDYSDDLIDIDVDFLGNTTTYGTGQVPCRNVTLTNLVLKDCQRGNAIRVESSQDVTISNAVIEDVNTRWTYDPSITDPYRVTPYLAADAAGIIVNSYDIIDDTNSIECKNITINNVTIKNCQNMGITVRGNYVSEVEINNFNIRDCGNTQSKEKHFRGGILAWADGVKIGGGTITHCGDNTNSQSGGASGAIYGYAFPNQVFSDIHLKNNPIGLHFAGFNEFESVHVATTANITISSALNPGDTLDGVTLVQNMRVLVKNQTNPLQNGIYIVDASPYLATDSDPISKLAVCTVRVASGSTNAQKLFRRLKYDTGGLTDDDYIVANGTQWAEAKQPVAVSTTNETLANVVTGYSIDGVTLSANDVVLLAGQTTKTENGLYVVSAGAPVLVTHANDKYRVLAYKTFVTGGTVYANTYWYQTQEFGNLDTVGSIWRLGNGVIFKNITYANNDIDMILPESETMSLNDAYTGYNKYSGAKTTFTWNPYKAHIHDITLYNSSTNISSAHFYTSGKTHDMILIVRQDAIGGRTINWSGATNIVFAGAGYPVLQTAPNAVDVFRFVYDPDGAQWIETGRTTNRVPKLQTPSGTIDGVNTTFTLATNVYDSSSFIVFLNGQALQLNTDYTVSSTTITMASAPIVGDILQVFF